MRMSDVISILSFLVALVGMLAAAANTCYLAILSSAASTRGQSGEATATYVQGHRNVGVAFTVAAVAGFLLTLANTEALQIIGLLIAGGAGVAGYLALRGTQREFRGSL
jgi:hypothetical protein